MRPLKTDRASTFERRVLDVESTGLGSPVDPKSDLSRPPRVILTVVRYPDGRHVRRWGERSTIQAIESLVEETADGTDIEVAAHFGGSFDFRLCLGWFLKRYTCRWRFTKVGSLPLTIEGRPLSAVKLRAGAGKHGEDELVVEDEDDDSSVGKFRLLDTIRILPGRLEEIGKAVGLHKGDWDHGWHATRDYAGGPTAGKPVAYRLHAPICYRALAEYCENDTDVLDAGIEKIERFATERGVNRRLTIASTSTASIRKDLTDETVAMAPDDVRETSKLACFGGRVEVFNSEAGQLNWYDIQSSYPAAMVDGLPWRYKKTRPTWDGEVEAIVTAVVDVPECKIPVLPMRAPRTEEGGRVYFPTGEWRGTFYGGELAYAIDRGYAKIIAVDTAHLFDRSDIMGDFAKAVWAERRVATGFYKYALKIWLNSAYGKLNETEEREELVVRPSHYICDRHRHQPRRPDERCGCMVEVSAELGLYSSLFHRTPSFHAPWAAAGVLGGARIRLHKFFEMVLERGGKPYYCDSVTGDRTVVLRRPDGRTCIEPIEKLASRAVWSTRGVKEIGRLVGWKALGRDREGREGWFDLETIVRHRVTKEAWKISAKDGQTEVTEDHGVMMGRIATRPADFVAAGAPWEKVRARKPEPGIVDLFDYLGDAEYLGRRFVVTEDSIGLVGSRTPASVRRFYRSDSVEMRALLRVVGAFVAEGSASIAGVTSCRMLFTISQKDRSWLEAVRNDLRSIVQGVDIAILETGNGCWSLRSGAMFLSVLFATLCGVGDGSKTKTGSSCRKLPEFCYDLTREDFEVLWMKLVEGDGHRVRRRSSSVMYTGQVAYTTTSQQLAAGISYALEQHGVEHLIDARSSKITWTIATRPAGSARRRRKVKIVRRQLSDEMVYDLQVLGAHTFVDGIGRVLLHNTDSIPTDVELPVEKGVLGALSLERVVSSARFVAPKLYGAICENCDGKDRDGNPRAHPHEIVKAKGFSGMKMADLDALICCPRCGSTGYRAGTAFGCPDCEGGSLSRPGKGRRPYRFERSEGLGEALKRRGKVDYRRLVFSRALRDTRPKRADGGQRPWTVEELRQRWTP